MDEGWPALPNCGTCNRDVCVCVKKEALRDYFAGQALATMTHGSPLSVRDLAAWCYIYHRRSLVGLRNTSVQKGRKGFDGYATV